MKQLMGIFVVMAATACAADPTDFSGKWKLDLDKSVFGPLPPPASMTRTVDQKEPVISMKESLTGPEMELTFTYSTDGKETANTFMGADFKSKAKWEGKALVIHNTVEGGGKSTDTWTLSDDGKTFTEVLSISSPDGDLEIRYVLVKQ